MEISAEKTKLMTNKISGINEEIRVNGQKLETVTSFKYLGSVVSDKGSKPDILSRIVQTTAALTRMKPVWNDKSISLSSKIRLMRSLVTSSFLYASESWTLTAELQRQKLQWYGHVSRSSGLAKNQLSRHSERGKKTRQIEEEVGRQHQGMDRPGVRQVPEGSGE